MVRSMSRGGRDLRISLALEQAHVLLMACDEGCHSAGDHGSGWTSQHRDGSTVQSSVTRSYPIRCGPDCQQLNFRTNAHQNRRQARIWPFVENNDSLIRCLLSWCPEGDLNPHGLAAYGF